MISKFSLPASSSVSLAAVLALAGCMAPPSGLNLALDRPSDHNKYQISLQAPADPIVINKMHAWEMQVRSPNGEPVSGARIVVGGGMPQHGHGFPSQPRVTRELGDGRYLIEGMKFSMPGWWEIKLKVDAPPGTDEVTFNTVIANSAWQAAAPVATASARP
jgi:hypothetical protein